jgi:hypothetical protein
MLGQVVSAEPSAGCAGSPETDSIEPCLAVFENIQDAQAQIEYEEMALVSGLDPLCDFAPWR